MPSALLVRILPSKVFRGMLLGRDMAISPTPGAMQDVHAGVRAIDDVDGARSSTSTLLA
jgi:hypothetical protein